MSQATDLLNNLTDDEIVAYAVAPDNEEHIIINADRTITVPESIRRIGVQYDHNVETVTFDGPRYWDNHDLSTMDIHINYELSNGVRGSYDVKNVYPDDVDGSMMHFTWCISNAVTKVAGTVRFLVCIRETDEDGNETLHWNSEINKDAYVSAGMWAPEPSTM